MTHDLSVATIQMEAAPAGLASNLARAEGLVRQAALGGARLVLLPEFWSCGYSFSLEARRTSEEIEGRSGSWLAGLARELGIWIGGCLYERAASGCFDTFLLVGPSGERFSHRKRVPASFESFLFEAGDDPIVVETALGRLALVVCFESFHSSLLREAREARPDLVLVCYSVPGAGAGILRFLRGPPEDYVPSVCSLWARACGVPVVASCQGGSFESRIPGLPLLKVRLAFRGQSAIYGSDGRTLAKVEGANGLALARLSLGEAAERALVPTGRYVQPLPFVVDALLRWPRRVGRRSYDRWRRNEASRAHG